MSSNKRISKIIQVVLTFLFITLINGLLYFFLIIIDSRNPSNVFAINNLALIEGGIAISFFEWSL